MSMGTSTRPQLARLVVPLDPVELPRRPRVALRVLAPDGQVHRVPPSDIRPNHPMMRNILPDFPPEVALNPQPPERVSATLDVARARAGRRRGCLTHSPSLLILHHCIKILTTRKNATGVGTRIARRRVHSILYSILFYIPTIP